LGRETLTRETQLEERVLLEIRTREGLSVEVLEQLGVRNPKAIAGLIADGLIDAKAAIGGVIKLTLKGRLLADTVVRQLLI
jgi:oxygen-independent coproporphyrinogen-3 oxidase